MAMLISPTHSHDIGILRRNLDPGSSWFTDNELKRILTVTSGDVRRAIFRALIGLMFRARKAGDAKTATWALNAYKLHEAGMLELQ